MFRFDEADPALLVVYTGPVHPELADYQHLIERLEARREHGPRFGMLFVFEHHEHHEDEELDEDAEAAYTQLLNDVRRMHRAWLSQRSFGYASVLDPAYQPAADDQAAWEQVRLETDRFSRYTLGVIGNTFPDEDAARRWLHEQAGQPPLVLDDPKDQEHAAHRIGLFYGSTTGTTEEVAKHIANAWQEAALPPLAVANIADLDSPTALLNYDYLILGAPTWHIGHLQDDWEILLPELETLDLSGVRVALFGVGDQLNYDENFLDAIGIMAAALRKRGAVLAGAWPAEGYDFIRSLALEDGRLVGLGIDELNQPEHTQRRVRAWVAQLVDEWQLQPALSLSEA